jgi:phage repressor protein C with HTH and peptisase S24 domain
MYCLEGKEPCRKGKANTLAAQVGKTICMKWGETTQRLRRSRGWSTRDLAKRVRAKGATNVQHQHIQQLEKEPNRQPRYFSELAAAFGLTVEEFQYLEAASAQKFAELADRWAAQGDDEPASDSPARGGLSIAGSETRPGYVRFQLLDAAVSAGEGSVFEQYPEVLHEVEVAEWWATANIRAPHDRVRLLTARGDSMANEINNGDVLFVDSGITQFAGDGIYIINQGGHAKVKQLQLMRDGSMAIVSLNPRYQTEFVPPEELDTLHIGGLLIGSLPFKRY